MAGMVETLQAKPLIREGLEKFDSCLEEFVSLITEITSTPAPSLNEGKRAVLIKRIMEEFGFPEVQVDEAQNVLGYIPGVDSSRTIVSMAHIDTVFPEETDLTVRRDGNILAAPGVSDNSASVALLLLLGRHFAKHAPLPHPVLFIANSGEEGLGDLKGSRYFCDHVQEYRFAGNRLDPGSLIFLNVDGNMGYLVTAGVGSRRLKITYLGKGGHSWGDFGASSAVHGLGTAICKIAKIEVPKEPKTTYNVGVISGGHSVNSIAQNAEMLLDMRSVDGESLRSLESAVRKCLEQAAQETGTTFEVTVVGDRPTGMMPENSAYVTGLLALGKECGYDLKTGASSTDSNIPLSRSWPSVTMGFKRSENGHRTSEFLYIDSLVPGIKFALLCFGGLLYDLF